MKHENLFFGTDDQFSKMIIIKKVLTSLTEKKSFVKKVAKPSFPSNCGNNFVRMVFLLLKLIKIIGVIKLAISDTAPAIKLPPYLNG